MPVKQREAKERRPQFSVEVLTLFAKLEATPPRRRRTQEFKAGVKRVITLPNLTDELWTMNSVLEPGPCYTAPPYVAFDHWHTCRRVRQELLAALARLEREAREVEPAEDEPAHP